MSAGMTISDFRRGAAAAREPNGRAAVKTSRLDPLRGGSRRRLSVEGGLCGRPLRCAKPFAGGAMMRGAEFGAQIIAAKIARGDKR